MMRVKGLTGPQVAVEKAVARCSWLVKARHYTRIGDGQISQRDALWASPTHKAAGRVFFAVHRTAADCHLRTAFIS